MRILKVIRAIVIVSLFFVSGCSMSNIGAAPSMTPTQTVVPSTPTKTLRPTSTPRPSSTPNIEATQAVEDALVKVQAYNEAGYLSSSDGKLYELENYFREMAKMNYLDVNSSGYELPVKNFAVWGHIKMQSAREMSGYEYSGCGFSFRINPKNYDGYTVHLTDSSVLMTYCDNSIGRCGRIGKTRGTGIVDLPNPSEADMEVVVNGTQAYVLVDGEFIGEYTLFTERLLDPGYLLYSIVSGTNAEYGTRCEIDNAGLWVVR